MAWIHWVVQRHSLETLSITPVYRLYHWNFLLFWKLFINIRIWKKSESRYPSHSTTQRNIHWNLFKFFEPILCYRNSKLNSTTFDTMRYYSFHEILSGVLAEKNQTNSTTTLESCKNDIRVFFEYYYYSIHSSRFDKYSIISAFMYRCILNCRK